MIAGQPVRCAIWARVSTADQHTENQLAELREWAQARGLEVAAEFITEDSAWNTNGAKGKQFDKTRAALVDGAKAGQYTVVLVWAIDRLSRKGIEDTLATLRRLSDAGCTVWSRRESWAEDLKDPHMRELFISIAAWVAKMESDRRSERVRAAWPGAGPRASRLAASPARRTRRFVSGPAMSPAGKMAAHGARHRLGRRVRTVSHGEGMRRLPGVGAQLPAVRSGAGLAAGHLAQPGGVGRSARLVAHPVRAGGAGSTVAPLRSRW